MSSDGWPDDSIFQHFNIFEDTYKKVNGHEIKTAVLLPKDLKPGLHPVIINIHGGFLVYGSALFAPFFMPWALKLGLENSAIIVSPDYRLLPSANGVADQLEDLEDFWQWTRTDLAKSLQRYAPGHTADLSNLLLTGGSAGGYCITQLALSHPDEIKAMATSYPFVDPADGIMTDGPGPDDPTLFNVPLEDMKPAEEVRAWIEDAKKSVVSRAGHERGVYALAASQRGMFYSQIFDSANLGRREDFLPLERVKAGARLPRHIWILHGDADTVVHIRATHQFVNLVREKLPETEIRLDIAPGEEHGFDLKNVAWELYAIGAMDYVKKSWLGA